MNFFDRSKHQTTVASSRPDGPITIKTAPVYYVTCDKDNTVLVAMDLHVFRENGKIFVEWFDTSHHRMMGTDTLRTGPNEASLQFQRTDGEGLDGTYHFVPMTLEIYREHVQKRLWNAGEFGSEEEMIGAFLRTMEDAD